MLANYAKSMGDLRGAFCRRPGLHARRRPRRRLRRGVRGLGRRERRHGQRRLHRTLATQSRAPRWPRWLLTTSPRRSWSSSHRPGQQPAIGTKEALPGDLRGGLPGFTVPGGDLRSIYTEGPTSIIGCGALPTTALVRQLAYGARLARGSHAGAAREAGPRRGRPVKPWGFYLRSCTPCRPRRRG